MSKDHFDRLVSQYSAEAEAGRAAEERSRQQSARLKKVANVFFWVLVCGLVATGFYFRDEIGHATQQLTGDKHAPVDQKHAVVDGNLVVLDVNPAVGGAPNKFANLQRLTQKHAAEVDSSGNLDARQAESPSKPSTPGH